MAASSTTTSCAKEFALSVDQLTVSYGRIPALWEVSCQVPQGHLVGILGPNGAGKTSFLQAILGLVHPVTGHIALLGKPIGKGAEKIAYVPQRRAVDWDFPITVYELVMMGRYGDLGMFRLPREGDHRICQEVLEAVGLTPFAKRPIGQLSGGQQQRAFFARALAQQATLYFLDEPFAGIDATSEAVLKEQLKQLVASGKTVFVVHHDLESVWTFFDWTILLNLRLIASGPTVEVFTRDNLAATFGRHYSLLEEALSLQGQKQLGTW